MSHWLRAAAAAGLGFLLVTAGCADEEGTGAPAPPKILSFVATPSTLAPGASCTLTFTAQGAEVAMLLDEHGTELPLEGDATQGFAQVTPSASTLYLLRVEGPGGRDTAPLLVSVGEPLQDVYLAVVPPVVNSGEEAQLIWSAKNARTLSLQNSADEALPLDAVRTHGVWTVTPARTTTYTLTASDDAVGASPQTVTAKLQVLPVLESFTVAPESAKPGETVTLTWTTRGAGQVTLKEPLFGTLYTSSSLQEADQGQLRWTVPSTLPGGGALSDNQPLHFTLEVTSVDPELTLHRTVDALVGDGPRIERFEPPSAVTEGKTLRFTWSTHNATRLELWAQGAPIFVPSENPAAWVKNGSYTLPAPAADTTYSLWVFNDAGRKDTVSRQVKVVKPPVIEAFQVPASVSTAGTAVKATWKVAQSTRVTVRLKGGPALYTFGSTNPAASSFVNGQAQLYPATRTTQVVLEASNAAGDSVTAERTLSVSTPAILTATPSPTLPGTTVDVGWNLAAQNVVDVLGVPNPVPSQGVAEGAGGEWEELTQLAGAKPVDFANPDDATAELAIPGFTFPFVDAMRTRFWVSTNGFVSFDSDLARPDNTALPSNTAPALLAPFWDDLHLGSQGKVWWWFDPERIPRRLIVQWEAVELRSELGTSSLSFQVQLDETGAFKFVYRHLEGVQANGASATVGAHVPGGVFPRGAAFNPGGTVLQSDRALIWFTLNPSSGVWSQPVSRHTTFTYFGKLANGGLLPLSVPVWVFRPNAVQISEAMPLPESQVAQTGAWVELQNNEQVEVDLGGLTLQSTGGTSAFTFPTGTLLPAGGHLVVGQSTVSPAETGGAPVALSYADMVPLAAADTLTLSVGSTPLSTLSWTAATPGTSVQAPEAAITSTGQPITCPTRTRTFGPAMALGTPGAPNETCFPYRLQRTEPNFRDISQVGAPLFATSLLDSVVFTADLSAHPVTLFGRTVTQVAVTSNGYLTLTLPASTIYSFPSVSRPSSSTPNETFAIFGDDNDDNAAFADANLYGVWVEPGTDPLQPAGHWIVQWHHWTSYSANPDDDLNFEIKLFENGSVEFHYGPMNARSNTVTRYAAGESATVWVEDGSDRALPISVQAPNLSSNSAYRFSPVP